MIPLDTIATLLSKRIGIDVAIIGDRKITRAVEQRRFACGVADVDAYLKRLQTFPEEFNELIEQIVVPETWFFRDRKPFDFLINFVRSEWLVKPGAPKLRVLSMPCSTGEEPYSIAIALIEAGLPVNRFSIDAIDISSLAIAKAQRAIYGKNSFRGEDWVERSRYFQSVQDKHEVCPLVRHAVNFQQGNVLDMFASSAVRYDMIFCRNLLIYLEDSVCRQIFNTLHRLLASGGLLFVGASETGKVPGDRFSFLRQSFTFAYCKIEASSHPPAAKLEHSVPKSFVSKPLIQATQPTAFQKSTATIRHPLPASTSSRLTTPVTSVSTSELQQARELADAGHVADAINCCKSYLESHSTNAEVYTLLGTLYQAAANYEQAERCFQKSLYLHPNYYEALMHLALLKESRGDEIGAERLNQRIKKLQPSP